MTHVPFRDSKLTRLLQESLGGSWSLIYMLLTLHLQLCISSRFSSFISYNFFVRSILSSHSHGSMQGLRGIRLMDRKCQDIFSDQHCPLQWVSAGVPLIPALWLKSKLIVIITTFWYVIDTIVWQDELANFHCFIGSVLNSWISCDTWAGHEGSHQGHSECGRGIQGSHQKSSGDARFARWETTTSWGTHLSLCNKFINCSSGYICYISWCYHISTKAHLDFETALSLWVQGIAGVHVDERWATATSETELGREGKAGGVTAGRAEQVQQEIYGATPG